MDNNTEDPKNTADTEELVQDTAEAEPTHPDPEPEKVVEKRGGGLSLLVALIALGGTGYLYYQQWQNPPAEAQASGGEQIQPLKDADAVLETKLNNIKVDVDRLLDEMAAANQQLQAQASQLAQGATNSTASEQPVFDNSANQAALERLDEQLSSQARRIAVLQEQLTRQQSTPVQAESEQPMVQRVDDLFWQQQAALAALDQVALARLSGRVDLARQAVAGLLTEADLQPDLRRLMTDLNNSLQTVAVPDTAVLRQQLATVGQTVAGISLVTEATSSDVDRKWYEGLISVKKIDSGEGPALSSLQLMSLKAELKQHLNQAEWSLMMQDQASWEKHLKAASERLQAELPEQRSARSQLEALATESVVINWPDSMDLGTLRTAITGLES